MEHYKLQIEGMSCKACGAIIKTRVQSLPEMSCVETDWQAGTVQFVSPDSPIETNVEQEIEDLGYVITEYSPVKVPHDGQTPVRG